MKNIEPAKKVLYDQAIIACVSWGMANFCYGILDDHDFASSCMQFTGYLVLALGIRFKEIYTKVKSGGKLKEASYHVFLKHFYNPNPAPGHSRVHYENVFHLALRAINFFALSWFTIIASHYAIYAKINFGIIASCICISTPLNCLNSYIFFGEKLTKKTIIGTAIILTGVVWVSIAKGRVVEIEDEGMISED